MNMAVEDDSFKWDVKFQTRVISKPDAPDV